MPRASAVPLDEAVVLVEKFIEHFRTPQYPEWSSKVWTDMSLATSGRWTRDSVITNVCENRRFIVSTACANQGIEYCLKKRKFEPEDSTLNDTNKLNDTDDEGFDLEKESAGLETMKIYIPIAQWKSMQDFDPVKYGDRNYSILRRGVWSHELNRMISNQLHLPCGFVFKNCKIYTSPNSLHYVRIRGRCKSSACNNLIFCYVEKDPGEASFEMMIKTNNTMHVRDHEVVKLHLRGPRRKAFGMAAFNIGCNNVQNEEIKRDGEIGKRIPAHVPNLNIIRQAKMEFIDSQLNVKPGDGKDVVTTIERMKNRAEYNGFIHEVKRDPFCVSFGTIP